MVEGVEEGFPDGLGVGLDQGGIPGWAHAPAEHGDLGEFVSSFLRS